MGIGWPPGRTGIIVAVVLMLALVLGAGVLAALRQAMDARLVRAFPDQSVDDPALVRFAMARAAPVFRARCAGCHGDDLHGSQTTGVPDLTDADWLFGDGRVSQIEQTILYGVRAGFVRGRSEADMPGFGKANPYRRYTVASLSPREIDAVTDYVLALGGRPVPGADVELGKALYRDKAQCFDCHENDARGDSFIGAANLRDGIWLYGDGSRAAVRASIVRGRAGICPAWVQRLKPAVVRAMAIFIHQRAAPASPTAKAS